jgi:hypothetical protein
MREKQITICRCESFSRHWDLTPGVSANADGTFVTPSRVISLRFDRNKSFRQVSRWCCTEKDFIDGPLLEGLENAYFSRIN